MKFKFCYLLLFLLSGLCAFQKIPLSQKSFNHDRPAEYERGIFLIVLSEQSLEEKLGDFGGTTDFVEFKQSQGYDVKVVSMDGLSINSNDGSSLKEYLQAYKQLNPMLEYVLLVGDWDGSYPVPTFTIPSYNENELDVTDYTYTYIDDNVREPQFFIGRWPVRQVQDLLLLKEKTVEHTRLERLSNVDHFNKALIVAGNFKDGTENAWEWPVTPRWTSLWLHDQLKYFGYNQIDTVFYWAGNTNIFNPATANSWNDGVGIVNYRGWGDANGWHKPYFHREEVDNLFNGWKLPIVLSFVCNTGDFGNNYSGLGLEKCFGEKLITAGTVPNPKGAVAMVGPSDLDTDTRFNNVICGAMWDEILEFRQTELAPALHAGKDSVRTEFEGLFITNSDTGVETNIPDFYYHIYAVLGDPSIPIRLKAPTNLHLESTSYDINTSFISDVVLDDDNQPIKDVVAALLYNNSLIGKDISNDEGEFSIDFNLFVEDVPDDSELVLYLNHPDYFQDKFIFNYISDNNDSFVETVYIADEEPVSEYFYHINLDDDYDWVEIADNGLGENLCLTDDSVTEIPIGFDFNYYGNTYSNITVSSNGWASFEYCDIPYFWNFSIPFPLGPSAMLAPFMDDLDDNGKEPFIDENDNCIQDNNEFYEDRNFNGQWDAGEPFNVFSYYDTENGRFIIQWDNVSNGEDDQNCPDCVKETFQLILLDQAIYQNTLNQGDIIFVYQEINDIDANGNFSTIGVESPDQNFGTQVNFSDSDSNIMSNLNNSSLNNEYAIRLFASDSPPLEINDSKNIDFSLLKTYPNPFNPIININYTIETADYINVDIYDIKGNLIENIISNYHHTGNYNFIWDAGKLASGNYIVKLDLGDKQYSNTITLLK